MIISESMSGLSKKEIEESYVFRLIKRAIKKEFPFVKDVRVDDVSLPHYNTIFVDMVLDFETLKRELNMEPQPWIRREKLPYSAIGLNLILKGDEDILNDIRKKFESIIDKVSKASAIPEEYILYNKRSHRVNFGLGDFILETL